MTKALFQKELSIAVKAAELAGKIQLHGQKKIRNIEIKNDKSPVTEIDKNCENIIIETISRKFINDGFLGEESGESGGRHERRWIIDPLDGTRPYIRGLDTYSVLIALECGGKLVLGVIYLPAREQLFYAVSGFGAFCNKKPVNVSRTADYSAIFGSAFGFIENAHQPAAQAVLDCMQGWDYSYGFMDALTYANIISGKTDVCINLCDRPWDCAAAACIVKEAGGKFSDLNGKETIYSGNIIISNGLVHDAVLQFFRPKKFHNNP